ncbi:MAG: hypothetical protein IJ068_07840 [Bacilli bacterium]|nr:hypothetical protein [Bacilli bacterium]
MKKTIAQLWEEIFSDYNIVNEIAEQGCFRITADQIRKYKEPRLMAKFDFSKQLPKVFKENELGILPIKNGEYIIGKFNLFENIENTKYDEIDFKKVELPSFIETIDPDNIYSESNALNVACLSGMFNDAFNEELYETIQGKMRTNTFKFTISSNNIVNSVEVNGAAIEIDGGYEGRSKVVLVEAKNSMPKDFVIRQLYYPYRHWKDKILKEIIPVFFVYDNGIYNMFIYSFEDLYNYNSLKLIDIKRYMVSSKSSDTIKKEVYENIKLIDELSQEEVPLPQADSFSKVIGALELINNDINTANGIATELEFDSRQGKYYIDALRYLELVEKGNKFGKYKLSTLGFKLVNLDMKNRNKKIFELILKHKPFYEVYEYYVANEKLPSKEFIKNIIRKYIPNMAEETVNRRASTIRGWIQWIIGTQV